MTIGDALRQEQDRLGLTEEEMVKGVMSESMYSRVINGQRNITCDLLIKLLLKHKIDINDFFRKLQ